MLTAEGCRSRRQRLLDQLKPTHLLVLADPVHLRYFANFYVEPFSLAADFGGFLVLRPDGHAHLYHDARLPDSVRLAHAAERTPVTWYTGQEPGRGPRQLLLRSVLESHAGRVHDSLADPLAPRIFDVTTDMRRRKDPDEIALLRKCMRATEAGHAWARENIRAGMTELDLYAGVCAACQRDLGHWAVVYGDFVASTGGRRVGPPTSRVLRNGETFILDFSVIVQGYRSDFTNTLVVGGEPSAEQSRLFNLCQDALAAGERELKAGAKCQTVYDSVREVFAAAGLPDALVSHAGHGLGAMHPEAPFIVRHSTETLVEGDVVTLEPGLNVGDVGIRIEHNYLVNAAGFERLSNHTIALV
ncbi:Proline dipeptidase OS=Planctomyces maris DSM 8797 GN=PM8797T_32330 PE=4 SV=1: Peptidase_M24 [Gemmataceae bacterium]|nr:Proline dipeptidase OS=Planctomyces maris DSM 8797 GN=PM8797T_32330 PE=4 SV=1: Peptidase_M24 [Gemmataceae bacterium]VTU02685.1 Proline dipeptidase OS=Planctomyces maris DSM 8797 GN=PM8797T_32330 PE=4 SV=1: Peptidase_M24 [Gemmataceae bacterium]